MMAGPYQRYVRARCTRNASLKNLQNFLYVPHSHLARCQISVLDYFDSCKSPSIRQNVDLDELHRELNLDVDSEVETSASLLGRILIVEDLSRDVVELLGSILEIDPLFFSLHLHSAQRALPRHPTSDITTLPSRLQSKDYLNLVYQHSVCAADQDIFEGRFVRTTSIDRKLVFLPASNVGLAQHSASVLRKQLHGGQWLAVILVDPPMENSCITTGRGTTSRIDVQIEPFPGPYEDFDEERLSFRDDEKEQSIARSNSMAEDLIDRFSHRPPQDFDVTNPSLFSLSYYCLQIVVAEWKNYISVMDKFYMQNEQRNNTSSALEDFNLRLRHLQSWRRRAMRSTHKVNTVITRLKWWDGLSTNESPALRDLITDYTHISNDIQDYGSKFESMIPMVTSLVSILDARHSFTKTSDIGRLTVLALIFVPLNYISSLFSMNSENAPGSSHFWVYFAVAIPITLIVAAIARPPLQYGMSVWMWLVGKWKLLWQRQRKQDIAVFVP